MCKLALNARSIWKQTESHWTFYNHVIDFYAASLSYMIGNYPYNEEVLLNAEALDDDGRAKAILSQIQYSAQRFNLVTSGENMDVVYYGIYFKPSLPPGFKWICGENGTVSETVISH